MRVTLLGTGSADGWPNPFCECGSCNSARAGGVLRSQTSALLDDVLLLDCGAETPGQAERAGRSLSRLTAVLVTHAHPDHFDPAFLLYRGWATDRPLRVLGTPAVVEECARWLEPGSPVALAAMAPGEVIDVDGYRVRGLAARHEAPGGALLYDVTAPDGDRLLYATDTGPLGDDVLVMAGAGPAYSTVLLEETFGDNTDHGTDHLDLTTFPQTVGGLRAVGALVDETDLVAVHLSHHNPPVAELQRRLRAYGARVVPDGSTLSAAEPDRDAHRRRRTLITGGARSGKSREAERLLLAERDVVYAATAPARPGDASWQSRVDQHRGRRPSHWRTAETIDLVSLLIEPGPPLLVDCLTLWLAGHLDRLDAWDDDADTGRIEKAIAHEVDALAHAWRSTSRRVVAVTNEVGSGVVPSTVAGGRFRDLLGRLNATIAAESDEVLLCVAGRVVSM